MNLQQPMMAAPNAPQQDTRGEEKDDGAPPLHNVDPIWEMFTEADTNKDNKLVRP